MSQNNKKKFKNFVNTYASMADVVYEAKKMIAKDSSLKLDKELLEYILKEKFGFDDTRLIFQDVDENGNETWSWYQAHFCEHRTQILGEIVKTDRFIGAERLDDEWFKSEKMSIECWKIYRGF